MTKYEDTHTILRNIIYGLGSIFTFISILHFGFFYYDLDKLITNIVLGILITLQGYWFHEKAETSADIKMLLEHINRVAKEDSKRK